jgi:sialate O-acetylesterase
VLKLGKLLWVAACSLGAGIAWGNVRLPALVGDGMVLQRDEVIAVWGWGDPAERVSIALQGRNYVTYTDKAGRWSVALGPLAAGGPYEMTVQGHNVIALHNILVGDVWLASGQSNMEFALEDLKNPYRETRRANFPQIRLFVVGHEAAVRPKEDVASGGWQSAIPESVAKFSAVAYLFGKELHERYHVPIGLIESSWGGTTAETWMSESALKPFPHFDSAIQSLRHIDGRIEANYERYVSAVTAWYQQHGREDRGQSLGRAVWADPDFDASHWPTMSEPRPDAAWGKDFARFSGIAWFRREINVPPEQAGKNLLLHLGKMEQDDTTYFNGEKVGETQGDDYLRDYPVPGKSVRAGRNVIAIRLAGITDPRDPSLGMAGPEKAMNVELEGTTLALSGLWSYQLGPEVKDFPVTDAATLAAHPSPTAPQYAPSVLFNGMIHPLTHFRIKGVIWYQGESNAEENRSAEYRQLFPALIKDWRTRWGYGVPFLFVQLAGYGPNQPEPAEYSWADLREAQTMALSLPHTGMATAIDLGDEEDLHPKNKQPLAHRLALTAFNVAYGERMVYSGPTYQSMQIERKEIRIKFSNVGSGLLVRDKYGYVRGFAITGADGKFVWAQARLDGDDVVVFNPAIEAPVAVRYDWSNTPDGNLFNREGLPSVPFRTDYPTRAVDSR